MYLIWTACIGDVFVAYCWCIRFLCPGLCPGLSAGSKLSAGWLRRCLWNDVLYMYCPCIGYVSTMYYAGNIDVFLMYYGCIGGCTPHLCFPPYSAHHLFGSQPIRASSFGHQQPMGMAPVGWGEPLHGRTRHAFWQTGHACSSLPCWVLYCRNYSWSGIHTGPLQQMIQTWDTSLLWGAKQGPKDSENKDSEFFSMYFKCICHVLTMYFVCIGYVLTGNYWVCTEKR